MSDLLNKLQLAVLTGTSLELNPKEVAVLGELASAAIELEQSAQRRGAIVGPERFRAATKALIEKL